MSVTRICTPPRLVLYLIISFLVLAILYTTKRSTPDPHYGANVSFTPSGYNWAEYSFKNPIPTKDMITLPGGKAMALPAVQHKFSGGLLRGRGLKNLKERRDEIRRAFNKTWVVYERHAWGRDELKPLSLEGQDTMGGWASSMIDSLDTLWLMDMKSEYYRAVAYVARLDWDNITPDIYVFSTNARRLGGLISAYELSGEGVLLAKAIELGDLLYAAFDNPQHMPPNQFTFSDLKHGNTRPDTRQNIASLASMALEFTRLSQLTGDSKYYDAVSRVTRQFERTQNQTLLPGMWPAQIDAQNNFEVTNGVFSLGEDGSVLYQSLLKEHMLLRGMDTVYQKMYRDAADTITDRLLFRPMLPGKEDVLMLGRVEVDARRRANLHPQVEHHTCFAGGMFALGGKTLGLQEHIEIGEKLARGCAYAYRVFPNGLMPATASLQPCPALEACDFNPTFSTTIPLGFRPIDRRYLLRPEAIESIFTLYRITGKEDFREIAWRMWTAVRDATETEHAFASVEDVTTPKFQKMDSAEGHWLAEMLKYFWLIFSAEDVLSLDGWLFNSQGHPFRRSVA